MTLCVHTQYIQAFDKIGLGISCDVMNEFTNLHQHRDGQGEGEDAWQSSAPHPQI